MKLISTLFILLITTTFSFSQGWIQQASGTMQSLQGVKMVNSSSATTVGLDSKIIKTTNSGSNWNIENLT